MRDLRERRKQHEQLAVMTCRRKVLGGGEGHGKSEGSLCIDKKEDVLDVSADAETQVAAEDAYNERVSRAENQVIVLRCLCDQRSEVVFKNTERNPSTPWRKILRE
ncbi:hypothetical protein JOM56_013050 [Amanita muscaria]